jgi:hypothetical protein
VTEKLWIYDLRTNKHFTLKENPLKREDLDDFVACYNPKPISLPGQCELPIGHVRALISGMNGDEAITEEEYYEALSLEDLGVEGCCKVFCKEYRQIVPGAELWGVKGEEGNLGHVFILNGDVAFDIRGGRAKEEMAPAGETITPISQEEFEGYHTFADAEKLLHDVASKRFRAALLSNQKKYGIEQIEAE